MTYGRMHITPMLVVDEGSDDVRPAKTVPSHFRWCMRLRTRDRDRVWGPGRGRAFLRRGSTGDGGRIALDLKRFVERSSGVFGKSGTGKTFLTRMVLAGIIQDSFLINLIFDIATSTGGRAGRVAARTSRG